MNCKLCGSDSARKVESEVGFEYNLEIVTYTASSIQCKNCKKEYFPKNFIIINDDRAELARQKSDKTRESL